MDNDENLIPVRILSGNQTFGIFLESYFNQADSVSFDLLMNALIIQYDIN